MVEQIKQGFFQLATSVTSIFKQRRDHQKDLREERLKNFVVQASSDQRSILSESVVLKDLTSEEEERQYQGLAAATSSENGALSDEACPSDCAKCERRFLKQRAREQLKERLIKCESGDMSRLESIQDQMAQESMLDMQNLDLLVAKQSK